MEIIVKKELPQLDRNDFEKVCEFVDNIVQDIWETSKLEVDEVWRDELKMAMVKDYMIDLINPDLLDFNSMENGA
jgi:5-methylthioribose kinase